MKNKIIQFVPVLIALFAIGFRYFSNWCIFTIGVCYSTTISHISLTITKPLYNFSLFFIPLAIILVFIPRKIFNSWLKFAVWALPLAFIYIAMTPVWDSSWLPFARDDAARLASEVFAVMSIIGLIFGFIRSHLYIKSAGRGAGEVESEMRELKTLFAVIIGLVSFSIFFCLSFSSSISLFGVCLLFGAVAICTNLYALFNGIVLSYGKRQQHVPFGKRLIATLILLSINITSIIVAIIAFEYGLF